MSNLPAKTFGSSDVTDLLVSITPIYLNTFLQRQLYRLKAEVREDEGGDKQRVFIGQTRQPCPDAHPIRCLIFRNRSWHFPVT
ncbi:MAG TPA: hypothetical protein VEI52_17220 [Terriglobales bacterium]|nr:hypothetical protein [Terriglobales bacterium]